MTPIQIQRREIERAEIKRMFAKYDKMDAERLKKYNRISILKKRSER
jgi:hypothetical protein